MGLNLHILSAQLKCQVVMMCICTISSNVRNIIEISMSIVHIPHCQSLASVNPRPRTAAHCLNPHFKKPSSATSEAQSVWVAAGWQRFSNCCKRANYGKSNHFVPCVFSKSQQICISKMTTIWYPDPGSLRPKSESEALRTHQNSSKDSEPRDWEYKLQISKKQQYKE